MSDFARSWVEQHSPYRGADYAVHLGIADIVNDMHNEEFWMRREKFANKVRLSSRKVSDSIRKMVADGYLVIVEDNSRNGRTDANRYRMIFPEGHPLHYDRRKRSGKPDDTEAERHEGENASVWRWTAEERVEAAMRTNVEPSLFAPDTLEVTADTDTDDSETAGQCGMHEMHTASEDIPVDDETAGQCGMNDVHTACDDPGCGMHDVHTRYERGAYPSPYRTQGSNQKGSDLRSVAGATAAPAGSELEDADGNPTADESTSQDRSQPHGQTSQGVGESEVVEEHTEPDPKTSTPDTLAAEVVYDVTTDDQPLAAKADVKARTSELVAAYMTWRKDHGLRRPSKSWVAEIGAAAKSMLWDDDPAERFAPREVFDAMVAWTQMNAEKHRRGYNTSPPGAIHTIAREGAGGAGFGTDTRSAKQRDDDIFETVANNVLAALEAAEAEEANATP